jgi:hypothetical protein
MIEVGKESRTSCYNVCPAASHRALPSEQGGGAVIAVVARLKPSWYYARSHQGVRAVSCPAGPLVASHLLLLSNLFLNCHHQIPMRVKYAWAPVAWLVSPPHAPTRCKLLCIHTS